MRRIADALKMEFCSGQHLNNLPLQRGATVLVIQCAQNFRKGRI